MAESQEQLVIERFDRLSPEYFDAYTDGSSDAHAFTVRRQLVYELLSDVEIEEFLDLGCGPGVMIGYSVSRGMRFTGLDVSLGMIRECAERFSDTTSAHFLVGDAEGLPFPTETFDAVVCMGLVEYLEQDDPILEEVRRILKPNGTVIVTWPNQASLFRLWHFSLYSWVLDLAKKILGRKPDEKRVGRRSISARRYRKMLRRKGFVTNAVRHYNFMLMFSPLDYLLPRLTVFISRRLEFLCRLPVGWFGTGFVIRAIKSESTDG